MASKTIRIRAKHENDMVVVKALIRHPMETGLRKDKTTGKKIPAHFIQQVDCTRNGQTVLTGLWGTAISADPYLSFRCAGKPGDKIKLSWVDNTGDSDSIETEVR